MVMQNLAFDIKSKIINRTYILQYIPKPLQEHISNRNKIQYKDFTLKTDYLIDIIHTFFIKYFATNKLSYNLSSLILRKKYGTFYNYYIDYLCENGFLKMESDYFASLKSKTYSIPQNIIKSDILKYKNYDKVLVKKYKNNMLAYDLETTSSEYKIDSNVKTKLISDLFNVYIDIDMAKQIVEKYKDDVDVYSKNLYAIESIENNNIYYHFDIYGRLHTNFTSLKSEIRKNCLYIDDMRVSEVDIRNSQPMFLILIIEENKMNIHYDETEYTKFKDLVVNGELYEFFMDKLKEPNKKKIKELVYKVFFGRNVQYDSENKTFRKYFPSVYNYILEYKKMNGSYQCLSYELQRAESNLIFNKVVSRIMDEYPHIRLFTIHDSICIPHIYKNLVSDILTSELNELINKFHFINN